MVQRIFKFLLESTLLLKGGQGYSDLGIGRGEYANNDISETTDEANNRRTSGLTMSLPLQITTPPEPYTRSSTFS